MTKVKDLTVDELELLIERKILEILGDPESGLQLREEFRQELRKRLAEDTSRIPHDEAIARIG